MKIIADHPEKPKPHVAAFYPAAIRRFFSRCCLLLLFCLSGSAPAQWYKASAFSAGEWLKYKVKWGFIRLGTIEVFQEEIADANPPAFRVMMRAKSAKLQIISVFFVNEGIVNPRQPTLQQFTITVGKDARDVTTYTFDPSTGNVLMKKTVEDQLVFEDSLTYRENLYDAIGTFMMIRCLSASGFNITLNNIIDFKICQTHLNFSGAADTIKVAAFDELQKGWEFSGRADWVGKAYGGVSGPFRGWISQDAAAIPLKVKVKIFLGSITIELEDFCRDSGMVPAKRIISNSK